jgi:predicted glycoside hydrolase/deacetylase ChbG (UPF0249 family)
MESHDGFRRGCAALADLNEGFRARRSTPAGLAARAAPSLRGLIAHLDGHHRIEDHHYFPAFRSAEPRLASGFEALVADHHALQRDIDAALASLAALTAAADAQADGAAAVRAAEQFVRDSAGLYAKLVRHLSDEEDLVVPLMLERGT